MTATIAAGPPRRSVAGRAVLAIALLLGFYAIAFAIMGGLVAANVAMLASGRVPIRLLIFSGILLVALARGVFFVERQSATDEIDGIPVSEKDQPALWAMVRDVARELGTEPPARLYLVPDVNAFVFQRSKLLGLVPGERVMAIGVPLLDTLTVDELRGVVAHEFGHYTGGDTRLGPLVYRGRASIGRTIHHLGEDRLLTKLFRVYGKLYMRVSQAVSRRQELAADANAARVAGTASHASALRQVHVAGVVFDEFMERYVHPLWSAGARPRDLYAGFHTFRTHPDHAAALERLAGRMEEAEADPYDSHPALGQRLAALGAVGDPPEGQPARTLLADHAKTYGAMSALLSRLATGSDSLRRVDWDDDAAGLIVAPAVAADRRSLMEAAGRLAGKGHASLADVLDLVEAGRTVELARAVDSRVGSVPEERRKAVAANLVGNLLASAVGAELTDRGYRWALRWAGPAALVGPTGKEWAFAKPVVEAVADPSLVSKLRAELGRQGLAA